MGDSPAGLIGAVLVVYNSRRRIKAMDFDPKYALERFRGMTREELIEEAARHADEYVPLVRKMLEGEALARRVTSAEIEACRARAAPPERGPAVDQPASFVGSSQALHLEPFERPAR